jgi:2,4-dienoyl-CoA reductase-like NADH-dependent reductase (Old Yellow Enzyme family)
MANSELSGLDPIGPSAVEMNGQPICRMAGREDMARIVSAFTRAAELAKRAGFAGGKIYVE